MRGLCGVRENRGGELYSLVYGKLVAESVDPIEKKPLFHVLPGSLSYSIATRGCNFRCLHCQNASISQVGERDDPARLCVDRRPEQVVAAAVEAGCRTISYTYVEPTVFFEFAYDCCTLAAAENIGNIFVSNGYLSEQATRLLAPLLTAINIDLKSFRDALYRSVCGARLQPVLDTIRRMHELGVWVEVTTLLIPGRNDSAEELLDIANFLAAIDSCLPWHVTAFHPAHYLSDIAPTPLSSLERAREIGLAAGLRHIYLGNVDASGAENTFCPGCGSEVIKRRGFTVLTNRLAGGACPVCATTVAGVW